MMKQSIIRNRSCKSLWLPVVAVLCAVLQVAPSSAQQVNNGADAPKNGAEAPKKPVVDLSNIAGNGILDRNHHLGPGDTIDIVVDGYPQFSRTVKLFADGSFDYPILDSVQAVGLTTKELRDKLTEGFRKELRRPVVYVNIAGVYVPPPPPPITIKTPTYVALGAIGRKGTLELPQPKPLRQIIEELSPTDRADLTSIRIRNADGSARLVDVSEFRTRGTFKDDIMIKGGEEIIVVEKIEVQKAEAVKVQVLGHVVKTGFITFEGNPPLLEVLDKAGGPKPGAALDRIKVLSGQSELSVDIGKYMGGDVGANYFCKNGDVILVSEKPLKVLVFGEVARPGEVAIDEEKTLARVLLEAGVNQAADRGKIELIRELKDGKVERKTYNLTDIERQKKDDIKLMRGDVLFVPPKKTKKGIGYYLGAIASPVWLLRSISPGFGL